MNGEINLEYGDVLKAYQSKSGELLTQLITTEAKLNASVALISSLKERINQLELEINQKSQKSSNSNKSKKSTTDNVVDYNS